MPARRRDEARRSVCRSTRARRYPEFEFRGLGSSVRILGEGAHDVLGVHDRRESRTAIVLKEGSIDDR